MTEQTSLSSEKKNPQAQPKKAKRKWRANGPKSRHRGILKGTHRRSTEGEGGEPNVRNGPGKPAASHDNDQQKRCMGNFLATEAGDLIAK